MPAPVQREVVCKDGFAAKKLRALASFAG